MLKGIEEMVKGDVVAPVDLGRKLAKRFRLIGVQGVVRMAIAAFDICCWDILAKAAGQPLSHLMGARSSSVPAYNSNGLGLMEPARVAAEALELLEPGFSAIKLRLGRPDAAADIEALRTVRKVIGPQATLMVDFNQGLSVAEAIRRGLWTLLVLALAGIQLQKISDRLTVIYLLDQSESIPKLIREAMLEYVKADVEAHCRKGDLKSATEDKAGIIIFGREATIEYPPFADEIRTVGLLESLFDVRTDATNIASALKMAQASFPEDSAKRVVIITDGNENLGDARTIARGDRDHALAQPGIQIEVAVAVLRRVVAPGAVLLEHMRDAAGRHVLGLGARRVIVALPCDEIALAIGTALGDAQAPDERLTAQARRRRRDARRPADWYRPRSSAVVLVGHLAQPVPAGVGHLRLQALALETGAAQAEALGAAVFRHHLAQALFDQRTQGRTLSCCQFPCLVEERG